MYLRTKYKQKKNYSYGMRVQGGSSIPQYAQKDTENN